MKSYHYPIIVIGAGSGGLVVAVGSAKGGKKVLLIERGQYGGDCTNFGCIPSKTLIGAAHIAHGITSRKRYGLEAEVASFEGKGALQKTREIVEEIRGHEDPDALKKLGVDTLSGTASFLDNHTLSVKLKNGDEKTVTGGQIVIATGSKASIPPIEGIDEVPYLTNETIFDLKEIPEHLGVIGGGPIGSELAQAFRRLGAKVSLIQHSPRLLNKEEERAQSLIAETFSEEGISLFLNHEPTHAGRSEKGINLRIKARESSEERTLQLSHLLVAAGRQLNLESLNLQAADVHYDQKGIKVDKYGRTSTSRIWACGDITGYALFTHAAENQGRTILRNLLVPRLFWAKLDRAQAMPRVTYTDPEIAAVGLTEQQAIEEYGAHKLAVYTVPFSEVDRAITAGRREGFVKIVTKKWSSRILGATIAAPRSGEMLGEVTLAMQHKIPLRKIAALIHPYPTYNLAIRKASDKWLSETILPAVKKWLP